MLLMLWAMLGAVLVPQAIKAHWQCFFPVLIGQRSAGGREKAGIGILTHPLLEVDILVTTRHTPLQLPCQEPARAVRLLSLLLSLSL